MKFYRVEHKETRLGPYVSDDALSILEAHGHSDVSNDVHPHVLLDPTLKQEVKQKWFHPWGCLRSGFQSKAQLHRWFSQAALDALKDLGFVIRTYEVPKVHRGEKQAVIFSRWHTRKRIVS